MKKLLWCIAAVGVLCIIVVIALGRNPDNSIMAISHSQSRAYEEIVVLKRDRTYEQLIRRRGDETIISHTGTWLPAKEDTISGLAATYAGTKAEDYIKFNQKLHVNRKDGSMQTFNFSLVSTTSMHPPSEERLAKWKEWRAKARPYTAGDTFKAPQPLKTPQPLIPKN